MTRSHKIYSNPLRSQLFVAIVVEVAVNFHHAFVTSLQDTTDIGKLSCQAFTSGHLSAQLSACFTGGCYTYDKL